MSRLKFLLVFVLPISAIYSFTYDGLASLVPLAIIFILFPLLETLLPVDSANLSEKIADDEKNAKFYDRLLYFGVVVYLSCFAYFLLIIGNTPFGTMEFWARTVSMGIVAGNFGFTMGHELVHRTNEPLDYFLGHLMLLTMFNLHFIPYHLGGHHRNVGKPSDPSTAYKGEWLYTFWLRSQIGGYFQAWQIENKRTVHDGQPIYSINNRMIKYTLIVLAYFVGLYLVLGWQLLAIYLAVVLVGTFLLEAINYIEHYGLFRRQYENGRYEPVRHHHSWNSDHIFGRALMFNLSRHADHHYNGSTKYQALRSLKHTPQMPTGYPGMVLMALCPPIWFLVMHPKLETTRTLSLSFDK